MTFIQTTDRYGHIVLLHGFKDGWVAEDGIWNGGLWDARTGLRLGPRGPEQPPPVGLADLVGHECRCEFDLPSSEWPIPGYPAWVRVLAVDMPMIRLASRSHGDDGFWFNVGKILRISKA